MDMGEICPCPKLNCPNHGLCDKCTSRHARKGFLNYCSFHTILPTIRQAIDESPESPTAKKMEALISAQLNAYEKLMNDHELSREHQKKLFKKVTEFSDH